MKMHKVGIPALQRELDFRMNKKRETDEIPQ